MEEDLNKIVISAILCLVSICNMSCGQNKTRLTNKESENLPCIDSVLQARYEIKKNICFSTDIKTYKKFIQDNNDIRDWLSNMEEEKLSAYTINNGEDMYLILISTPIGATGIATSFYYWLLIDYNKKMVLKEIENLSQSTRSWFIENDKIHFIAFEFGNDFYHGERDYAKLPITATEYILDGNSLIEVSSLNVICSGI